MIPTISSKPQYETARMGEADNYYSGGGNQSRDYGNSNGGYQQQQPYGNNSYQQQPPPTQQYQQPQQQPYQQPPPPQNGYDVGMTQDGEKSSFDQAFNVPKPKYNDLWAGILVS